MSPMIELPSANGSDTSDTLIVSQESFRSARHDRLKPDWYPPAVSGDAAIGDSWDTLLSRVREMARDVPEIIAAKRALGKCVIGEGMQAFADALLPDSRDEYDDDFNDASDDSYTAWSEEHECDAEGDKCIEEMQWHTWDALMDAGEVIWLETLINERGRRLPLAYQMLEAEQIDDSKDWDAGEEGPFECKRGIEYDPIGRPVAYWIFDNHPYDNHGNWTQDSTRIPASRVLHLYWPDRLSSHRGISWFRNLQTPRDLDMYLGSELTSANIEALFSVIIKRKNQGSGLGGFNGAGGTAPTDQNSNTPIKLGRGVLTEVSDLDDVHTIEKNSPNKDAKTFVNLMQNQIAMAAGISVQRMIGNFEGVSYSGNRAAQNEDMQFVRVLQKFFKSSVCRPVRKRAQAFSVAQGDIPGMTPARYRRDMRRLERFEIQPAGREQLDPRNEQGPAMDRVKSGMSTLQIECGQMGRHWRKIARQKAREIKFYDKLKIPQPDFEQTAAYYTANGQNPEQPVPEGAA